VSRFPVFPETKDPAYDAVALLNAHAMFANDEGLMAFPPARTYEGPACGSLLVAADTPAVRELGFEHGENALLHRAEDVEDFARVVRAAVREPERLEAMAAAGASMVRARYSHEAVADRLHGELCRRWAA
jgi:glycosyltransferase involved in cell wall biosynthesis